MDWVFAYGSLLPAGHAALPDGAVAAHLLGWRRSWSVAMDNSVDLPGYKHYVDPDGDRPDLMVCYLDVAERDGRRRQRRRAARGRRRAAGARRARAQLRAPRGHRASSTSASAGASGPTSGRRAGRARARRGRRERRLAIASSYHERVLAGFDLLRQRRRFEMLTEPANVPVADLRSSTTRRWPCRAAPAEPSMRLIDLFEVSPDADEAFLADWESERVEGGVLYRALREDVDFASCRGAGGRGRLRGRPRGGRARRDRRA